MTIEALAFLVLVSPYLMLWRSTVFIKRHEKSFKRFYFPLREEYPRSYHKQNKVIVFVRDLLRMNTDESVHWVVCLCHYAQIYYALAPIWMLFLIVFLPFSDAMVICIPFGHMLPIIILFFWLDGFSFLLSLRCQKIRKINPKYSNVEVLYWRRR